KITTNEMLDHLEQMLDYIDEPFADSSAIAVNILCRYTREKVTVALSGDGGDELFAGYNKHKAAAQSQKNNWVNFLLKHSYPLLELLPSSRSGRFTNFFRQLKRYAAGLRLSYTERYWRWCSISDAMQVNNLFIKSITPDSRVKSEVFSILKSLPQQDLNGILLADMRLVLAGDMLVKVDYMSMANSLEVRVPLLDYHVVNYAFSLPFEYKLKGDTGKFILKDAFRNDLPEALYTRAKKGFEVPLLKWFRTALREKIEKEYLADEYIKVQNIFNPDAVKAMLKQMCSSNPGDVHARLWALIVFQHWYKKYFCKT
ncbi:MAG: asparagine synthase C-terminal domain-containing protein, partial [Chitinophagales bacterium]|nr:asparagine synthase C-terminal domain-containing protein [Chitinophagales bacterium]